MVTCDTSHSGHRTPFALGVNKEMVTVCHRICWRGSLVCGARLEPEQHPRKPDACAGRDHFFGSHKKQHSRPRGITASMSSPSAAPTVCAAAARCGSAASYGYGTSFALSPHITRIREPLVLVVGRYLVRITVYMAKLLQWLVRQTSRWRRLEVYRTPFALGVNKEMVTVCNSRRQWAASPAPPTGGVTYRTAHGRPHPPPTGGAPRAMHAPYIYMHTANGRDSAQHRQRAGHPFRARQHRPRAGHQHHRPREEHASIGHTVRHYTTA